MPLVRYVGGTWRVGGILALSRAFGDAYLKGSLQFEGVRAGGDGYSSGFGVVAEPDTSLTPLTRALPPAAAHPPRCSVSKAGMCLAKPMRHAHGLGSPKSCLAISTGDMRGEDCCVQPEACQDQATATYYCQHGVWSQGKAAAVVAPAQQASAGG